MNRPLFAILCAGFVSAATASSLAAEPREVRFNRDVRQLLSDNCFHCHGPDGATREADLRLDLREAAVDYGEITPGKPDESELVRRLFAEDPEERMPPANSHKKLTDSQKETLRLWVEQGAQYEGHWAYEPVSRTAVPAASGDAVRHPVDAFIDRRLAEAGIEPSPQADPRTLLRRLHFDLTGLPPTPAELEAFADNPSPAAFEAAVDRCLDSPHFGEMQALRWLDAVRYADTTGFHGDQDVEMWPYRDYVLAAFNDNMPFDQFTREQIAGDLLPEAGRRGQLASAFNRLNRMTTEGGAQDKEYLAKYAGDRVRTVSMAWLGSTMGCAECHDHKFDPFTARDFYAMEAFFADVQEKGFYPSGLDSGDWGPRVALPSEEQTAALEKFDRRLAVARGALAAAKVPDADAALAAYEARVAELDAAKQLKWHTPKPLSAQSSGGATMTVHENGDVEAGGQNPASDTYTVTLKPGAGRWTALRLVSRTDESYPGNRFARGWRSFVVTEFEAETSGAASADRSVGGEAGELAFAEVEAHDRGRDDDFPAWAAIDGDPATGWGYPHAGSASHWIVLRFAEPLEASDETTLTVRVRQDYPIRHATIAKFALQLTEVPGATGDDKAVPPKVLESLKKPADERGDENRKLLADHLRTLAPELAELRREIQRLEGERALVNGGIPTVLTTQAAEPREIRVLPRGNWMDDSGEVVEPSVPEFLGKLPLGRRATRLDLANWIVSPQNPLTARVISNRVWTQFFGAGLSRVLEDVGSQGEWPSHPELLDWLAAEFVRPEYKAEATHGWDYKHLVRTIVTSEAYKRSSLPRAEIDAADPENRLLARQNPVRFDAEVIRDQALAAAGLLVKRVGGPSVFPWQPEGLWAPLNFPKREYSASVGEGLYRRSLYTHWQRTFVHPTMLTFDSPTREECQVSRPTSTTPLQALVLLNDPIYVEAAEHFGRRMIRECGESIERRIEWAFEHALSRKASPQEVAVLMRLHEQERGQFASRGSDAPLFATQVREAAAEPQGVDADAADLAATAAVARVILNLSETITRY